MTVSRSVPANRETETTEALRTIAAADIETCLSKNNTSVDGLSNDAVSALKSKYGPNEIRTEKAPPWHRQLIRAFVNPFSGILLMIVAVTIAVNVFFTKPEDQDYKTVFVVVTIILLSSLLRFFQEYASNNAAAKLRAMIQTNATVLRQGTGMAEVPLSDLVPGDIVILSAGDMIPADCRLIHAKDLFLSESMLTGEPMPVEKHEQPVTDAAKKNIFELGNICFMGTNVLSGSARAVVLMTGNRAFLGSLSNELTSERKETSFDKGINSVSWLLIKFMMVMVPLVFIANVATKGDWLDALLFSVAIAVGLTPEMLPMIVTANLSRGAIRMSKHRVIVKQINSIQNFGAMDVLCTDKTGTLTMDQIALEKYLDANGIEDKEVLKWAYLNSYYQTGLKNLMDVAVLEHKEWEDKLDVANEYKKTDEIPFDFQRRRMSVVLGRPDGRQVLMWHCRRKDIMASTIASQRY